MTDTYYSVNAGLAPLRPQDVTVGTSVPTADVYVFVSGSPTGVVNKMQFHLILEAIQQLVLAQGVGTQYQTDDIPAINP